MHRLIIYDRETLETIHKNRFFIFFLIFQFVHDMESGVKFQDLVTKNDTFGSEKMKSIVLRAQEELWEAPQHSTD